MPTKKKRVGFIPRENVMKIIEKLGFENNLSNSKIISILVEEALVKRGIFKIEKNIHNKKIIFDNKDFYKANLNSKEDNSLQYNKEFKTNNSNSNIVSNNKSFEDEFDLNTYKKFLSFMKFQEMVNRYGDL